MANMEKVRMTLGNMTDTIDPEGGDVPVHKQLIDYVKANHSVDIAKDPQTSEQFQLYLHKFLVDLPGQIKFLKFEGDAEFDPAAAPAPKIKHIFIPYVHYK